MSRGLLVEYIPFAPSDPINESNGEKYGIPGGMVVHGVLQRAGAKNQNGRIYPKHILQRELDHPESSVVNLNNVSHNVLKVWWDGDNLNGAVQVLDTPAGNILKSLFKSGITLGISSRGLGSVKELYKESAVEVQDDFELICWDFVSNPSTNGAFMRPMNESVTKNKEFNQYKKVNNIITSILCDDGKCRIMP